MFKPTTALVVSTIVLSFSSFPALSGEVSPQLKAVLSAQSEETQARYEYRHPAETLTFFGIKPGMTLVEGLPGAGWYSRVLAPYIGPEGRLIGVDYAQDMWPLFGFFSQEFIDGRKPFVEDWPKQVAEWEGSAPASAFKFGSMPDDMKGSADAVLLIRALHNLARFEEQGGYLSAALGDVFAVLKPGGIVGVVQHEARPDMPDDWANGSRGYLKKAFVIERMQAAGFEFVAEADFNQNEKDQPTTDDVVWRLPPTFNGVGDDEALRAKLEAIGESNRMTLKFKKPGA